MALTSRKHIDERDRRTFARGIGAVAGGFVSYLVSSVRVVKGKNMGTFLRQ